MIDAIVSSSFLTHQTHQSLAHQNVHTCLWGGSGVVPPASRATGTVRIDEEDRGEGCGEGCGCGEGQRENPRTVGRGGKLERDVSVSLGKSERSNMR